MRDRLEHVWQAFGDCGGQAGPFDLASPAAPEDRVRIALTANVLPGRHVVALEPESPSKASPGNETAMAMRTRGRPRPAAAGAERLASGEIQRCWPRGQPTGRSPAGFTCRRRRSDPRPQRQGQARGAHASPGRGHGAHRGPHLFLTPRCLGPCLPSPGCRRSSF